MVGRFYFDIDTGEATIRDMEGVEAADLAEALSEAEAVIAEMAEDVQRGGTGARMVLIVRNEDGAIVGQLPITR